MGVWWYSPAPTPPLSWHWGYPPRFITQNTFIMSQEIILSAKTQNNKAGRPMVLLITSGGTRWVTQSQWLARGYGLNLDKYVKGEFLPEFYMKGEKMFNGAECTSDNAITKDFRVVANAAVVAKAEAAIVLAKEEESRINSAFYRASHPIPAASVNPVAEPVAEHAEADLEA